MKLLTVLALAGPVFGAEPAQAEKKIPAPDKSQWRFGAEGNLRYREGDYDTRDTLRTTEFGITLSAYRDRFDVSITQYYLDTDTTGAGSPSTGPGGSSPSFEDRGRGRRPKSRVEDESGLGDAYLDAGVTAWRQSEAGADIRLSGGVKIPTADDAKGLGTGEADWYLYISGKRRESDWIAAGRLGRIFWGDTRTTDYKDSWAAAVGAGPRFDVGKEEYTDLIVWLRGQTAAVRHASDPLELAVTVEHGLPKDAYLLLEVAAGLTAGAADYTLGIGVGFYF